MKNQNIITLILVAVVMAGAGFFAGSKYQQSPSGHPEAGQFQQQMRDRSPNGQNQNGQFPGAQNRQGQGMGLRPVNGTILSVDSDSLTVELPDGSSKIILLNDKSAINKTETGALSDLVVGETVVVFGTENSDGSVTAQNVQLNPGQPRMEKSQ